MLIFYSRLEENVVKLQTSQLQTAINCRGFDPQPIAQFYFRSQLVNFGPITEKIKLL